MKPWSGHLKGGHSDVVLPNVNKVMGYSLRAATTEYEGCESTRGAACEWTHLCELQCISTVCRCMYICTV